MLFRNPLKFVPINNCSPKVKEAAAHTSVMLLLNLLPGLPNEVVSIQYDDYYSTIQYYVLCAYRLFSVSLPLAPH